MYQSDHFRPEFTALFLHYSLEFIENVIVITEFDCTFFTTDEEPSDLIVTRTHIILTLFPVSIQ